MFVGNQLPTSTFAFERPPSAASCHATTTVTSEPNPSRNSPDLVLQASTAVRAPSNGSDTRITPQWLISSPYSESGHLLALGSLDQQNQLLARALASLDVVDERYATKAYEDAFDWTLIMSRLRGLTQDAKTRWLRKEFYVVEFRSRLKSDIDTDRLHKLDKESHREATESGGLLKYWYGRPDDERRNLATCLWRSKEDAVKGGQGTGHGKARAAVPIMYEEIRVNGLRLTIDDDVSIWKFETV